MASMKFNNIKTINKVKKKQFEIYTHKQTLQTEQTLPNVIQYYDS